MEPERKDGREQESTVCGSTAGDET
jgi:hypothetical protein